VSVCVCRSWRAPERATLTETLLKRLWRKRKNSVNRLISSLILSFMTLFYSQWIQIFFLCILCQDLISVLNYRVNQVNEGVREKENSERLEWIQNHVQCDGATEVTSLLINLCYRCNELIN